MLRPDAPKQGKVREPRPGESADELGELRWTPKFGQVAKRESRS